MAEDKRTKIGPTGPDRQTGDHGVAASVTPAPITDPPTTSTPTAKTSYLPDAQTDPMLGQTLAGRYLIVRKLGEGGMGAVYLATHLLLEKQVALKVLHGEFARKPDLVERFMQEAKAASRIRHENVIDISDFGTTPEGLVFFAMELLKGHDLHEEVARARLAGQLLPYSRSKRIFLQICAALSAAHGHGIIHRDLKPENVYLVEFLGEPDFVKLLDFGIAKLTETTEGDRKLTKTGMLFGTPEYMSPEQARGEPVDLRVDVYAMGCILFQLVTGRVPFEAENFMGVLSLHLTEPPPTIPLDVFATIGAPPELAAVIERALAKDRTQRYPSIDELANAVRVVSGDPPSTTATAAMLAQRAPSVTAPATTSHRAVTPAPTPALTQTSGRQRTQWTGTLSVPQDEDAQARSRSKLPLLVGIGAVLVGGAIAAVVVMRGGDTPTPPPREPQPRGNVAAVPTDAAVVAPVTPDAPLVAEPPPAPDEVMVKFDSRPRGAQIKELASGTVFGKTPATLKIRGSNDPRQFALILKGYSDAIIELVPNRQGIEYTEKLERGESGAGKRPGTGSGSAATVTRPETGSATTKPLDPVEPAGTGSATGSATKSPDPIPPPPEDECDDPPCLKTNVPGLRGSAGGSATDE